LMMSAAFAGTLGLASCGLTDKHHATAVETGTNNWNMARLAIMYQLAETQYKAGDYDKCNTTLKDAFATKAQFAPIYVLSAKVEIEQGNLEQAANHLNAAIRIKADDPEPYYLLGVLHQRWQKPEAACDYYKQAWSKKQDEVRYLLATVEMEITLGRLTEAQTTLESRMVYFEQSAAVRIALARIASLKNDYTTACKYYRDAVILMPEEKNLQRMYAESLFYAGQYPEAALLLEDIRKRPNLTDHNNVMLMLGQSYLSMHRARDARNCFQEAIRDNPNDNQSYINLGKACLQTGELGLSLSASKKVLKSDPDNVQALIILALVQQKQAKWADAAATLSKAGKAAPTDATVLCLQGITARQLGNLEQASACFEKALRANPNDAWAVELLGHKLQDAIPDASVEEPVSSPAAANTPIMGDGLAASNTITDKATANRAP